VAASAEALEVWRELVPVLHGMGLLTLADRHALGLLADTYRWWRARPDDARRRDAWRRTLGEFGLTPVGRSSLKVDAPGRDPLDDFLGKK
jgi:hypothetical protein